LCGNGMNETTTKTEAVAKVPGYGEWIYHLCRKWNPPAQTPRLTRSGETAYDNVDPVQLIGLATIMASYGEDGRDIYPPAPYIARHAGKSVRTVKTLRQQAITLGMFRVVGRRNGRDCLVIAIPPDAPESTVQQAARSTVQQAARFTESREPKRATHCTPTVQHTAPNLSNSNLNLAKPIDRDAGKAEPVGSTFADKSLAELVREAPNERALDCLWRVHRGEWSAQLTELASARKAELGSASANDSASAEPNAPLPTESASLPERTSLAYETTCDVDEDDETCTVYESGEFESSRFSSPELTGYRAKKSLAEF
jgi:hypothetical protein